jgi:hypothetical protein
MAKIGICEIVMICPATRQAPRWAEIAGCMVNGALNAVFGGLCHQLAVYHEPSISRLP